MPSLSVISSHTHTHTREHCMHTDLRQPHPATVTPLHTPSLHRRFSGHRHRLHLFLPTPVRTQDATHIGGQVLDSGTFSSSSLSLFSPSVLPPLSPSLSSSPRPLNRLQPGLLGSCFCQLERRRGRPFPFSWLSFSLSATGTEGRIHPPPPTPTHLHKLLKTPLSPTRSCCSHMWTPHFSTSPTPSHRSSLFHTHCYKYPNFLRLTFGSLLYLFLHVTLDSNADV